jgi:hypothetical protein
MNYSGLRQCTGRFRLSTDRDEHPVAANIDIPVTRMNEALLLSALQLSIIEERIL